MRYVAGVGIVNCDLLYSGMPRLPAEGEEVFSRGFDMQLGGGVPAIMINLTRLGIPVQFSTFLGQDHFSSFARMQLEKQRVPYRNLYEGDGMPVNVTSVAVTPGDRTFISYHDAFSVTDKMKEQIYEQFRGACIVRMHNRLYDVYSRLKKENPDVILVMDTGWDDCMSLETYGDYLELADYYTPNCKEALKLTGTSDPYAAAEVLSRYFHEAIVKLGPGGCLLRSGTTEAVLPAVPGVDAVDATGAGDAFTAGFIYGLYHGYCVRDSILFGNITGGECVRKVGCLSGYLTEPELLRIADTLRAGTAAKQ